MTLALLLLNIGLMVIRPVELFPEWQGTGIMPWTLGTSLVVGHLALFRRDVFALPQIPLCIALVMAMCLSVVVYYSWPGGAAWAFEVFAPPYSVFLLASSSLVSFRRLAIFAAFIIVCAMLIIWQGHAALTTGKDADLFILQQRVSDTETTSRIQGLGRLNDPNQLAQFILVALALVHGLWMPRSTLRNVVMLSVPAAWLLYGVYLTRSRGGLIGLCVLCVLLTWSRTRLSHRVAAFVLLLTVFAVDFTGGRSLDVDESGAHRIDAWIEGLQMFRNSPFLGVGFGHFLEHNQLTAHNSFILCLAELGFLGYFVWLSLVALTVVQLVALLRTVDQSVDDRFTRWARALVLALAVYLTTALFLSSAFSYGLYLLIGGATALLRLAMKQGIAFPRPRLLEWTPPMAAASFASIILIWVVVKISATTLL